MDVDHFIGRLDKYLFIFLAGLFGNVVNIYLYL
jgi:hypothetical protein